MKRTVYTLLALALTMTANADNSVAQNRANNQACITLTTGEVKYYNTSQLSSIAIDDAKVTVTTSSQQQDIYDGTVSAINYVKKSVDTVALNIEFANNTYSVSGDTDLVTVTQEESGLVVTSTIDSYLEITLSGTTTNYPLTVYSQKKYGITLNGVSITNSQGPAINNQCGKSLYITLAEGTTNTLTDGTTYATATIDQKGTLFSEGQIYFQGNGTLNVNGNAKNGIASDDFIVFEGGTINVNVAETGTNGVKVNDGITINGGTLSINVKADGARGIKNDAYMAINGGTTTITTSGDCLIETADGVTDTTSCAGIKCDSLFTMTAGTLTISSSGDGGKGINCAQNITLSGGTMTVTTTGSNDEAKPKAVKSDTGIILSGGSFYASCKKSWACDNGSDSDEPANRVTIVGTPTTTSFAKKEIKVIF